LEAGGNSFDLWLKIHSTGTGDIFYIPLKQHFHFNQYADWNRATSIIVHKQMVLLRDLLQLPPATRSLAGRVPCPAFSYQDR
jgi:hypothetical protein